MRIPLGALALALLAMPALAASPKVEEAIETDHQRWLRAAISAINRVEERRNELSAQAGREPCQHHPHPHRGAVVRMLPL